jgi:CRP-like cAMP-binding protein
MRSGGEGLRTRLGSVPLLQSLEAGDIDLLLRLGRATRYDRERVLTYQGEKSEQVFLVVCGGVRLLKYCSDDTCLALGTAGPGEWVGLTEVTLHCPSLVDATALGGSEVLAYSPESLARARGNARTASHLTACMARNAYRLHLRIEENTPLPRLIRFLREHASSDGEVALVCATQDQIAEAIGVTRETVNRHLHRLQAAGLVALGRGSVEITDPTELESRLIV